MPEKYQSEVVDMVFKYRDQLNRREETLLKRMARLWRSVESETTIEALRLAQLLIDQQEQNIPLTPQYVYSLQRYKAYMSQAKKEIEYYDKNIIDLITDTQRQNFNLGIDAANQVLLKMSAVESPTWTVLHRSAFEAMAGMLGDGTPLSRLISKDYGYAVDGINKALLNGVAIGKGYQQVATDMVMASRMAFERSVVIARTEINRAYRLANTEQYRQSGIVKGFKRLVYKPTACFACLMMDGEFIPVDQELYDHPRGKCSAIAVLFNGQSAEWQTGQEWFKEQSEEDQRRIMGGARYEAWKLGEVKDLRSMVYMKPNAIWGPAPAIKNLDELSIHTIRSFAGENYFYVPASLSEYFTEEFAEATYQEALAGGKFAGALKSSRAQSDKSLNKSIRSFEKQVAEHVEKIMNPEKFIPNWEQVDERKKPGIIKDWTSHMEKNKKNLDVARKVREERMRKSNE